MLVSHLIKFRDELIKKIQLINESGDQMLTPYNLLNSVINDYIEINPISFSQEKISSWDSPTRVAECVHSYPLSIWTEINIMNTFKNPNVVG